MQFMSDIKGDRGHKCKKRFQTIFPAEQLKQEADSFRSS